MKSEWLAAGAAFLLLAAACAPPQNTGNVVLVSPTPTQSPTPTPTTAFAASVPGFHTGEVGIGYAAVTLTATGGVPPYSWAVAGGALPPGLTLGADGRVSGTPAAAGTYTFMIQAADAGDGRVSLPGVIKVVARLSAALLPACAQYCRVELGCSNVCGAFGSVSGGVPPLSFTVKQGPLPAGTTLSASSLTLNGTFGGQPGYLPFTVQVGDAFGATATVTPTFWMYSHLAMPNVSCTSGSRLGTKCTVTIAYTGGKPGQKVSLAPVGWTPGTCAFANNLPCPEPTFSALYGAGQVSVTLTYDPKYPSTYGKLAIRLTGSDPCGSGASCTALATIAVNG